MAEEYKYEVFLSHNSKDKPAVEQVGRLLRDEYKIKAWLDKWNLVPGEPWQEALEDALDECQTVAVFLGPSGVGPWENEEMRSAIEERVRDPKRRVIPVLLPGAPDNKDLKLPRFLRRATWVDFRAGLDDEDALYRVYCGITGRAPGDRRKAATTPNWHLKHPYPLPPNFTGRVDEKRVLSAWLDDTAHPLLAVRALGGFGKSALCWHWLNHEVDRSKWSRVVWWSFYEGDASFENFLNDALEYLVGKEKIVSQSARQQAEQLLGLLREDSILLVLDGFERALRAFSGMGAAYQADEGQKSQEDEGRDRDCISPAAEDFLRGCAALPDLKGKILMTTRLRPRVVESSTRLLLNNCQELELNAINPEDAVAYMRASGIQGTRAEILAACERCGRHPLSLSLLAGLIVTDVRQPGDITVAQRPDIKGEVDDVHHYQHHVLELSYNSLTPERQKLLSQIACFRGSVRYEAIVAVAGVRGEPVGKIDASKSGKAVVSSNSRGEPSGTDQAPKSTKAALAGKGEPIGKDDASGLSKAARPYVGLDNDLRDLVLRGLLHQTPHASRPAFDLHPIVRRYAYERLTAPDKIAAHQRLADYFAAVPPPEKVEKLDELAAVIELYHHMVRAGKFDEAFNLYFNKIGNPIYYQFGAYQICIELLLALFPDGENNLPRLKKDIDQGWTLNSLSNNYGGCGQMRRAIPMAENAIRLAKKMGDKKNIAVGLGNLANRNFELGRLMQAEHDLRQRIDLCHGIDDNNREAVGHQELGRLLSFRGAWQAAEQELLVSEKVFDKLGPGQTNHGSVNIAYRSLEYLLLSRSGELKNLKISIEYANHALELANEHSRKRAPYERDYIRAHWLLGAAYRASGDLPQAETHLGEALRRCRGINLAQVEADILLELARLSFDYGLRAKSGPTPSAQDEVAGYFAEALRLAGEALVITERSEYALQGADVNLFLAELALAGMKLEADKGMGDRECALLHARQARRLATGWEMVDGQQVYDESGEYVYKVAYDEAGRMMERLEGRG